MAKSTMSLSKMICNSRTETDFHRSKGIRYAIAEILVDFIDINYVGERSAIIEHALTRFVLFLES